MKVGVVRERAPNERRVALVPEVIGKLTRGRVEVLVESGAGGGARSRTPLHGRRRDGRLDRGLYADADVVAAGAEALAAEIGKLRQGQVVIGLLQPLIDPATARRWPRRASRPSASTRCRGRCRAQTMDALSSQANVGGYKAVLIAAEAYGRYFPLLTTAAGTAKPANLLVLGIGVAGLQAIATARRLGALVKAYDVRSETREQAESLGAQFLVLKSVADAAGRAATPAS